ncbi:MAG TPA: hypothetical protein VK447_03425 [Myxococcaceae bacterium]|nr:hypothetical protein [Myxococcaceae bacterium]
MPSNPSDSIRSRIEALLAEVGTAHQPFSVPRANDYPLILLTAYYLGAHAEAEARKLLRDASAATAKLARAEGALLYRLGRSREAIAAFERAVKAAKQDEDAELEARCQLDLGYANDARLCPVCSLGTGQPCDHQPHVTKQRESFERALDLARERGRAALEAEARTGLAFLSLLGQAHDEQTSLALRNARDAEVPELIGCACLIHAESLKAQGKLDLAKQLVGEAREALAGTGDEFANIQVGLARAEVEKQAGQPVAAAQLQRSLAAKYEESGLPLEAAHLLYWVAASLQAAGLTEEAKAALKRSVEIYRRESDERGARRSEGLGARFGFWPAPSIMSPLPEAGHEDEPDDED